MNRLVIVGNGFDLAHGLPTAYCDFINNYWSGVFSRFKNPYFYIFDYKDDLISFSFNVSHLPIKIVEDFRTINSHSEYIKFLENCSKLNIEIEGFNYIDFTKNSFFQTINNRHHIQNWVDIENEYYTLLKDCLKEKDDNSQVKKLNKEFDEVKGLLSKYLNERVNEKFEFELAPVNNDDLLKHFSIRCGLLDTDDIFDTLKEFPIKDHDELKSFDKILRKFHNGEVKNITELIHSEKVGIKNLFLNFNYTPTLDVYKKLLINNSDIYYGQNEIIQIHGRLNSSGNQMNFGFGDEMDNHYKLIEEKDDNEYLKNIKSFQYLQNSNYKDMLDFIESDKFQVYIMGHSCGLSDRILLNKIFEHHNCRSIKVFYHQFDEPKADGRTDNYTEIVQNISRHFNKKEMMREKIVNKSLCQPLPQNIRFGKKQNGLQE